MQIRKKGISLILSVFMICMMFYMAGTVAYAADVELSHSGSISITMHNGDESVGGGSLVCYKAGYVNKYNRYYSYKLTDDFSDSRIPLDNISNPDTADKLTQWVQKENLSGISKNIDESGHVVFTDLKPGLYLMVQDKAAAGYYKAVPFLVSVPMNEGGRYIYDVEASPKVELVKMPEPTKPLDPTEPTKPVDPTEPTKHVDPTEPTKHVDPTEPTKSGETIKSPEPKLPQTGQLNWPVPVMCISGLMLLAIGLLLRTNKKKMEHEK